MKHYMNLLAIAFCVAFPCYTFLSCNEDDSLSNRISRIRIEKINLNGAKMLGYSDNSTKSRDVVSSHEVGLFKIDENGNITTAYATYTYDDETGETTSRHGDLIVIPHGIANIENTYTFLEYCDFKIEGSDEYIYGDELAYSQFPENPGSYHMLIRNSDGQIFAIIDNYASELDNPYLKFFNNRVFNPERNHYEYYYSHSIKDNKGNVYLSNCSRGNTYHIGKLTIGNNQLKIDQINPNNIGEGSDFYVQDNGTVVEQGNANIYIYYPDGSFNTVKSDGLCIGSYKGESICFRVEENYEPYAFNYILKINEYKIGTTNGSNSEGNTLVTIPIDQTNIGLSYLGSFFESDNYYFLNGQYCISKNNLNEIKPLSENQIELASYANPVNTFNNRTYSYREGTVKWFDLNTLQDGEYSLSDVITKYKVVKEQNNIPNGLYILQGVSYENGNKSAMCIIDLIDGSYSVVETDSPRSSFNCVKISE